MFANMYPLYIVRIFKRCCQRSFTHPPLPPYEIVGIFRIVQLNTLYRKMLPSTASTVAKIRRKVSIGKIKLTAVMCALASTRESITSSGMLASGNNRIGIAMILKTPKNKNTIAEVIIHLVT